MKNYSGPKQDNAGADKLSQSSSKLLNQSKHMRHTQKSVRMNISMPPGLVKLIDEAAEQDFTTRSDVIRMAVLWYLRPQGRELNQADPDVILKTLQRRKALVEMSKTMKDVSIFDD